MIPLNALKRMSWYIIYDSITQEKQIDLLD